MLTGHRRADPSVLRGERGLRLYSNSRIWLDDPRDFPDLARALSAEGMFDLRDPGAGAPRRGGGAADRRVTVLVALGLLASLATVVVAVQVAQRRQDRWRADDAVLTALGGTRGARAVIHLASVAAEVVLAVRDRGRRDAGRVAAWRPIGPLHDLDPAQGVHLDLTVAAVGVAGARRVAARVGDRRAGLRTARRRRPRSSDPAG